MLADAKDFFIDGQNSKTQQIPILVMFSEDYCPYCELIKSEVIKPMSELKEYKSKVILRHIIYNSTKEIIDFSGNRSTHKKINDKYNVNFYPTLILLDHTGKVLETKIGVVLIDYYWTDLDILIENATQTIRGIL